MSVTIRYFLLLYDRERDDLVEVLEFDDADEAAVAYERAEQRIRSGQERLDALLVGADSLETVKVTHSNYFPGGSKRRVEQLLSGVF